MWETVGVFNPNAHPAFDSNSKWRRLQQHGYRFLPYYHTINAFSVVFDFQRRYRSTGWFSTGIIGLMVSHRVETNAPMRDTVLCALKYGLPSLLSSGRYLQLQYLPANQRSFPSGQACSFH